LIIGFGFGSPLTGLVMLLVTSLLSYALYRAFQKAIRQTLNPDRERERRRAYYLEMREQARRLKEYDLSDEEIEHRLDDEFRG